VVADYLKGGGKEAMEAEASKKGMCKKREKPNHFRSNTENTGGQYRGFPAIWQAKVEKPVRNGLSTLP